MKEGSRLRQAAAQAEAKERAKRAPSDRSA
jgi:hypothetical protein